MSSRPVSQYPRDGAWHTNGTHFEREGPLTRRRSLMAGRHNTRRRVVGAGLSAGLVAAAAALAMAPAGAATTAAPGISASFNLGVLTVVGDATNNAIVVSRNAAGTILVNGARFRYRRDADGRQHHVDHRGRRRGQRHDQHRRDERRVAARGLVGGEGNDTSLAAATGLPGGSSGQRHDPRQGRRRHPLGRGRQRRADRW